MLAVNGAMMKPSRSLMFTNVRLAESASELKVYLWWWMNKTSENSALHMIQLGRRMLRTCFEGCNAKG